MGFKGDTQEEMGFDFKGESSICFGFLDENPGLFNDLVSNCQPAIT